MIDYLGNVGAALKREDPAELQRLYEGLRLEIIYHADQKAAEAVIQPGRDSERVRGGTRTPVPRGSLEFQGISMKPNISARWVLVGVQVLLVEVCHSSGHVVRLVIRTSDTGRCLGASEMTNVYW
jgi:hypothetical protein